MKVQVEVTKIYSDVVLPKYQTDGAAGMDVRAYSYWSIDTNETLVIKCGFKVAIPEGYEIQVRSRSGLAAKGVVVANSPGTIDSDYRGEVGVILHNTSNERFYISHGDRIAQLLLAPVTQLRWKEVEELDETARGHGAMGSTGVK